MMKDGYILSYRSIWFNDLFVDAKTGAINCEYFTAWSWMLHKAQFKANGIGRGELRITRKKLADLFFSGSEQKARTFLTHLTTNSMVKINRVSNRLGHLISIENYDRYQDVQSASNQLNNQLNLIQQPTDQPTHKRKKEPRKKDKNTSRRAPARTARATRLPDDWILTKSWGDEAKRIRPEFTENQIRSIADEFRDYWIAKPGKDGTKTDWLATWRNWIRRARVQQQSTSEFGKTREELANERWLERTTEKYRNAAPAVAADDDPYGMADVAAVMK